MNKRTQQEINNNIATLCHSIDQVIDAYCKDNNYVITYAEINSALSRTMARNLNYEIKSITEQ